jgi:hypothetical protein
MNKNPMKKSVLSTHHSSMVVRGNVFFLFSKKSQFLSLKKRQLGGGGS